MIVKHVEVISVDVDGYYNRLLIALEGIIGRDRKFNIASGGYDNFILERAKSIAIKEYKVNPNGIVNVDFIERVFPDPPKPTIMDDYCK